MGDSIRDIDLSKNSARQYGLLLGVVLAALLGGAVLIWRLTALSVGVGDFRAYWSASRLLMEGRNSYDPDNMLEMEQAHVDPEQSFTMMAWNPPTTFVFILPLAWAPFQIAKSVWFLVNLTLILLSCLLLGLVYLPPGRVPLLTYNLIAVFFAPVLVALLIGQITFLVVFGVAASIALIKRENFFWAGVVLILTSVKPHMVMLIGPYLLLYMALRRKWPGWLGLGVAGAICVAILFILRPGWVTDFQGLLSIAPVNWATPTLGGFLATYGIGSWSRYLAFAFLPMVLIFLRQTSPISLETAASVLVLVTIPTTFFGWSYDQSLLLMPIAQIIGWLFTSLHSGRWWATIAAMVLAMTLNIVQRIIATDEVYYVWVPIAWGAIYVLAFWLTNRRRDALQ